jgi:hypothetical protein
VGVAESPGTPVLAVDAIMLGLAAGEIVGTVCVLDLGNRPNHSISAMTVNMIIDTPTAIRFLRFVYLIGLVLTVRLDP